MIEDIRGNSGCVLLTGGAGYIGSVVTGCLAELGVPVIVIDDLRDGKQTAILDSVRFIQADVGDRTALTRIFSEHKIASVMHFAASANVPDSVVNPSLYYGNNVASTLVLLDCMIRFKVPRLIFSSTAAVYGEPQYSPIDELHPLLPMTPYGKSKLMCEQIISDYAAAYGLEYIVFRYFCAAGATEKNGESRKSQETHLIPVLLDTLLGKREKLFVYGDDFPTPDGTGIRDYIHVDDIARAHVLALRAGKTGVNEAYNLGSNRSHSVREIVSIAERMYHCTISRETRARRPGDPAVLTTTSAKAVHLLGWRPEKGIEDIIASAYEWRRNPRY